MSIFKEHKSHADRSATDRRRHREKIDKAIKEGVTDIIAEESIIGQNGKKKIKIPVRGIKQYKFIYGSNQRKGVGSSAGNDVQRGQKVGKPQNGQQQQQGNKPGEEAGEEYYEVEITLEELATYLFDSLQLPELEKKQFKKMLTEKMKRKGYRNSGIRPRLDKKESVKKMLKRRNIAKRTSDDFDEDDFPFRESDLRYKHIAEKKSPNSNAAIFFVMDISGSMTKEKKYLARSFFFLLYHFIRSKYDKTEIIFVAHDAQAYEVSEEQFFSRGSSGGTLVSSALAMVNEIITSRYHPSSWNVYMFQCSDGDNWSADNEKARGLIEKLQHLCQFIGYCEVEPMEERIKWNRGDSGLLELYSGIFATNVKSAKITTKTEIWPAFKKFFGGVA
jgi:sporulation protein YhbH